MTTKNIQDVVAERVEEIMEQKPDCDCNDCRASFRRAITQTLTQLVKEVEEGEREEKESILGLLKIARCPDSNCDNEGTGVDGYGEPYQCQWCYERQVTLTPPTSDEALQDNK